MPRDKEFQQKRKDTRMPARDSHAEERMEVRQGGPDFDLRRARDAPPSPGTSRNRRYDAAAQPAAEDSQSFTADVPQQSGTSIPEDLTGRDLDHEPARYTETRSTLEPEPSTQDPRRRNFRYENSRREDSDSGSPDTERHTRGESGQTERRRMHQHGNQYQQRFQEAAKAE